MSQNLQENNAVSVCIPSYNHSLYIEQCLKSIFAQTYAPSELIVIDDGSTDNSVKIIEKTLEDCPFPCKLIVRPNKGHVATINEGLEQARGEFFALIASDDFWLPKFLERRVNQLKNRPTAVLAYGHCYNIDENDKLIGDSATWAEFEDGDARAMLLEKYPPIAVTVLYRKAALEIQKWNPEVFVEDFELFLRLCLLGDFAFDPQPLSAYRIHSTNISRQTKSIVDGKVQSFQLNAESLGLSRKQMDEVITRVKWDSVDYLLTSGKRFDAVKLALQSSHVKLSTASKLKQYLKLALPKAILKNTRKMVKQNNGMHYGTDIKTLILQQSKEKKHS